MSSGKFIRTFYETNGGAVCRIRVQPETELASIGGVVNDAPAGPPTISTTAKVSKTSREYGIKPRRISFAWDAGQEPTGYDEGQLVYIPIMTRAVYDGVVPGEACTYLAGTGVCVNKLEEQVR